MDCKYTFLDWFSTKRKCIWSTNQSLKSVNYNPNSVRSNKIQKRFLCEEKSRAKSQRKFRGKYTQRNLIKSNRNQIVFTISDWFGTKWTSVWLQIKRKMVNRIWFRVDLIRFRKKFSVCMGEIRMLQITKNNYLYIYTLYSKETFFKYLF